MNEHSAKLILVLNSGSSSLKFALIDVADGQPRRLLSGVVNEGENRRRVLRSVDADGRARAFMPALAVPPQSRVADIGALLKARGLPAPVAIGHRIVHGGIGVQRHQLIDAGVLAQLEAAAPFAPLHMRAALDLVRCARTCFPDIPQIACLDTVFHASLPAAAATLPLPREMRDLGVRRYGFHGLSCASIVRQLGAPKQKLAAMAAPTVHELPRRLVIAHLGSGCSVTAVANGISVDTSMGMTPSGGVIMGTRCGDIDPGLLVWLIREQHLDAAALEALVDHRSGLLGISGLSGDLRALRAAVTENPDAALAVEMFCRSVHKQIAAMAAVLDGIDLLVFTGGIGENDAATRAHILAGLSHLGAVAHRVLPSLEAEEIAILSAGLARAAATG